MVRKTVHGIIGSTRVGVGRVRIEALGEGMVQGR